MNRFLFLILSLLAIPAPADAQSKGYVPPTPEKRRELYAISREAHGGRLKMLAQNQALPDAFDCRDKGWVLPVGDQGNCVLPDAKVLMSDGRQVAIQDVRIGDKIRDADGGISRVNYCLTREVDEEVVCIEAGESSVWLTSEHPVFIARCVQVPAGEVNRDDVVLIRSPYNKASLEKAKWLSRKKYKGVVFNLIVSSETFVVNGICVHNCGSCYLYSTVYGTLTQAFVKAGYGKNDGSFVMSVQFFMDSGCGHPGFGGCGGGNGTEVIDWIAKNYCIAEKWVDTDGKTHNDYPAYSARSLNCRLPSGAKKWTGITWGMISASPNRPATVLEMETSLVNFGAANISLDAGGGFNSDEITQLGNSIDHEIECVAYNRNRVNKDGTKGAFLFKNQWNKSWGDGGYKWCTYKTFPRIVDPFFVAAAPLPPPPPPDPEPPTPPIPPGPIGGNSIVITLGGKSTTYLLVDPARHQADVDALDAILQRLRGRGLDLPSMPEKTPDKMPEKTPAKLPEGPKEEKKPEAPPDVKVKPKIIDGVSRQEATHTVRATVDADEARWQDWVRRRQEWIDAGMP